MSTLLKTQSCRIPKVTFILGTCLNAFIICSVMVSPTLAMEKENFYEANADKKVRQHLGDIVKDWSLEYAKMEDLKLEWYDLEAKNKAMCNKDKYKDKKIVQNKASIEYVGNGTETMLDANFKESHTWVHNGTKTPQTPVAILRAETQSTTSWMLSEDLRLGIHVTASAASAFGGLETGIDTEVEFHKEKTVTKAKIQSWEIDGPVQTPENSSIKLLLTIAEKEIKKPFKLTADIEGDFAIKLKGGIFQKGKGIKVFPISKVFENATHKGYTVTGNKVHVEIDGEAKSEFGICGSLRYLQFPFLNGCENGQEEEYLKTNIEIKKLQDTPKPSIKPQDGGTLTIDESCELYEDTFLDFMYRDENASSDDKSISIDINY